MSYPDQRDSGAVAKARADHAVEVFCDSDTIETVDFDINFVRRVFVGNAFRERVQSFDVVTGFPVHSLLRQFRPDNERWLVVHQVVVNHGLAITVLVNRWSKDLSRMQCRRGSESDTDRVEMIEDASVFGNVLHLIAVRQFMVTHFLVEYVAAVTLVDDDAVVLVDRER